MTIASIRLVISQPPVSKTPSEWDFYNDHCVENSISILKKDAATAWGLIGKPFADIEPFLVPGEKQCQYCKAKIDCPAAAKAVDDATGKQFGILPDPMPTEFQPFTPADLAALYLKTPMIRKWCDAIDQKAIDLTLAGEITPEMGLKVVAGREGNRAWDNEGEVEAEFKTMRLKHDQMFTYKLISPAQAEKVLADSPRKWKKIQERITRSPAGRSVVPVDDKRPALEVAKPSSEGFDDVSAAVDSGDDLV